jgi:chromosome segregation ATPase
VQVSSQQNSRRARAAALIRQAGIRNHNNELTMLATGVELDAFTKVKKAIDDMIAMLKQQQEDEVKKNDYCGKALQENEMTTMKTEDLRDDQNAKVGSLESTITTLTKEIAEAKDAIKQAQVDLQRASQDRQVENLDFQKTIADQTVTIEILHKAMDRLAQFYDSVELMQTHKQTPPVAQAEYKPSAGAGGVISMIEKLIYDAKDLMANSKASESEAQEGYETLVADTNASVDKLTKEVAMKTEAVAKAKKDLINTQGDLEDTIDELEGLAKYNADLHAECDYVMKNFNVRQKARGDEISSLQEAKQILDGANLGF